jgi:hypothetical protein
MAIRRLVQAEPDRVADRLIGACALSVDPVAGRRG